MKDTTFHSACLSGCLMPLLASLAQQDSAIPDMTKEEQLSYLTRLSPQAPDLETLLWALATLVAALVVVCVWNCCVTKKSLTIRTLAAVPVLASFLWFAVFLVTDLFSHLSAQALSSAVEPCKAARSLHYDKILLEIRERLPEETGIVLINCRVPRQVEWSKYLLYPREIMIRDYSLLTLEDPRIFLTPETCALLASEGVDWILDCAPDRMEKGADAVLIPVRPPRKEQK
ncbi:MAG: hypothetical protein ABIK28_11490 [Planctomycetota bacterium]